MMGIAFARASLYTDGISAGGLGSFDGFNDSEFSSNFGLDLALDFRPFEFARIGLVARNVNAPKFSAGEFGDIRVRPAVRLGMAITPIERLVLAMDVDLTDNRFATVDWQLPDPCYSSRLISLGSEYTIPLGKPCALALRFGGYTNLTGSDNESWAMTGGLGLKLWGFWLDMSAARLTPEESGSDRRVHLRECARPAQRGARIQVGEVDLATLTSGGPRLRRPAGPDAMRRVEPTIRIRAQRLNIACTADRLLTGLLQ